MSLTDVQLAIRRTGLTAGDMRAIVAEDPYGRTAHDVWCSKMGLEGAFVESEAMSIGNEFEAPVLRRLAEKRGLWVLRRDPQLLTMRHPEHAHHIATPDALLAETRLHDPCALGEAKVVGAHAMHEWGEGDDEIPDWTLVQVTWQMHVSRIPVCYVGALCGTMVRTYRVALDTELEGVLVEECDRFHRDHIVTKRPPEVDGSAGSARMLKAMWPRQRDKYDIDVRKDSLGRHPEADELERQARAYFEAEQRIKVAESDQELAKQRLLKLATDADSVVGDGWRLFYRHRTVAGYAVPGKEYRHFDLREIKAKAKTKAKSRGKKAA